jgi:hypothetical protein
MLDHFASRRRWGNTAKSNSGKSSEESLAASGSSALPIPLLRRSPLYPGESLPSLLIRLLKRNHYDTPRRLDELILNTPKGREGRTSGTQRRDNSAYPIYSDTYARLSALTGISQLDLYAATVHTFASVILPFNERPNYVHLPVQVTVSKGGTDKERLQALSSSKPSNTRAQEMFQVLPPLATLANQIRSALSAQCCIRCIRNDIAQGGEPYHRVMWCPYAVSVCLEHRCLLTDRCPSCRSALSITDVITAQCAHCGFLLAGAETLHNTMEQDHIGLNAQETIQGWFMEAIGAVTRGNKDLAKDAELSSAPSRPGFEQQIVYAPIPNQPVNILYRVLYGLRLAALNAILRSLAPEEPPKFTLANDGRSLSKTKLVSTVGLTGEGALKKSRMRPFRTRNHIAWSYAHRITSESKSARKVNKPNAGSTHSRGAEELQIPEPSVNTAYREMRAYADACARAAPADTAKIRSYRSHMRVYQPIRWAGKLTSLQEYLLYTTAFKGLSNWPQGFHEFLEASREHPKYRKGAHVHSADYRSATETGCPSNSPNPDEPKAARIRTKSVRGSPPDGTSRLLTSFGYLYSHLINHEWMESEYRFMRSAFNEYFAS